MGKKLGNTLKYSLSFSLAAILLWLAFRGVDWKVFSSSLRQTDWRFVAVSMGLGLGAFTLRGFRWNQLMRPLDGSIGYGRTFDGVCIGNLANCALPFAGEFVRCAVVSTRRATYDKTLGTIALERAWDLISIIFIFILILVFKWDSFGTFFAGNILDPAVSRLGGMAWVILTGAVAVIAAAIWTVYALRDRNSLCNKIFSVFKGMLQGFGSVARMERKPLFLAYTVVLWTFYWLMCVSIARAFPGTAPLGPADALFIMAVGSIASVIPVPGGFGAYHYIVALTLSTLYGFSWESGILFATLSHESQAVMMVTSGLGCWLHRSLGRNN